MASNRDLTYGRQGDKHDALLEKVRGLLPDWLNHNYTPADIVVRLIWLDQKAGKDNPDNVIWMSPGYGLILTAVEIVDPEIQRLIQSEDPEDEKKLDKINRYKVRFTHPEDRDKDPKDFPYPEWMAGKERTIVFYGQAEADRDYPAVFTATPDGTYISLR